MQNIVHCQVCLKLDLSFITSTYFCSWLPFCEKLPGQVVQFCPAAGYDEYSLLYSTRDFFPLLVPYSEILLLGRVASNGNECINDS